jgi:hypothetical protein
MTKTSEKNVTPSVAHLAVATPKALNTEGSQFEKLASNVYYGEVHADIVTAFHKDIARGDDKDTELKAVLGGMSRRFKNEFTHLKLALATPHADLVKAVDAKRKDAKRLTALRLSFIASALKPSKPKTEKGKTEKATPFEALVQAMKNAESALAKAKANDDEMQIALANAPKLVAYIKSLG